MFKIEKKDNNSKNKLEEEKIDSKKYYIISKVDIKLNLNEVLFFNRQKRANELATMKKFNSIINLDNVTEKYIYEYLLINKQSLDFTLLENKTLISGLNREDFESLKINVNYYCDYKKEFFDYINLINNDLTRAINFNKDKLLNLYINEEMLLNQPLSFNNNPNLMYYSILYYLIPSSTTQKMDKFDDLQQKKYIIGKLKKNIYNIESLTETQIWNLIFYMLSINDSEVILDLGEKLKEKIYEEQFDIIDLDKTINCQINKGFLYGYNSDKEEVIKIPLIEIFDLALLKQLLSERMIKIENIKDVYDNIDLLKCIKIEYLNKYNYYTPHLDILKIIIKDILTSKAIDEYIDIFSDHTSKLNPFKNEDYFNLLWEKYIHFVVFQKEDFFAETFRIYHKVFFNSLPFFNNASIDINLRRLFNYCLFVIISIHELLGHLEKIILYYANKKIKVKTEELKEIEFKDIFLDDLDEEIETLQNELKKERMIDEKKNLSNQQDINDEKTKMVSELLSKLDTSFNGSNKGIYSELSSFLIGYLTNFSDDFLIQFQTRISLYLEKFENNKEISTNINEILKIVQKLLNKNDKNISYINEGGYIVENILYGSEIFSNLKELSINQVLFILNSNNYTSIQNMRTASSLYISYRFAKNKKRDYINSENYSKELKKIISELGITNILLENQDKIIISEMYSEYLLYRNEKKKLKKKQKTKFKGCIPKI